MSLALEDQPIRDLVPVADYEVPACPSISMATFPLGDVLIVLGVNIIVRRC